MSWGEGGLERKPGELVRGASTCCACFLVTPSSRMVAILDIHWAPSLREERFCRDQVGREGASVVFGVKKWSDDVPVSLFLCPCDRCSG